MSLFSPRESYKGYNIYSMKKNVDKRRVIVTAIIVFITILSLSMTIFYLADTKIRLNRREQFAEFYINLQKEREERKAEELANKPEPLPPQLTEQGRENLKNIFHSETRRAFLTFDDGPTQHTEALLMILRERNIRATFFLLGSQVNRFPELTRKIYEDGHFIANHGYSHVFSQIYSSPEAVLEEYMQTRDAIRIALNQPEFDTQVFRFPGGFIGGRHFPVKEQAAALLAEHGIMHIDWNALTGDAERQNPTQDFIMQRLRETTYGKNSVVILMHESMARTITVDTLPAVIDFLMEQGYEFMSFHDLIV